MLKLLQHGLHPHWELDVRGAELDAQVLPLAALEREPGVVRGPGPWAPEDRDAAWWNALPLEEWLPPEAEWLGSERWAGAGAGGCAGSRQGAAWCPRLVPPCQVAQAWRAPCCLACSSITLTRVAWA